MQTALLIAATLLPAIVQAEELKLTHRIGTRDPDRAATWDEHIEHASWLDDDTIIYRSKTGVVTCRRLRTDRTMWTLKNIHSVRSWSVSRKQRRLAILHTSGPKMSGETLVRVIDCTDGKSVFLADGDALARLLGVGYAVPIHVSLSPPDGRLAVFGRSGCVLNAAFTRREYWFKIDAAASGVSFSPDGSRVVLLSRPNLLCVRTVKTNQEIYFHGKRVTGRAQRQSFGIDAPFMSHARHDGDSTIVYTIDNSWATGRVFVHNIKTDKTKSVDARNGHIEMDVDFPSKRIALTGTSTHLTLMSVDGALLADLPNATLQRNACVEFSPSGDRILVGSWDKTVSIFAITK